MSLFAIVASPERFQAKWLPVRVKKTRQGKYSRGSDSVRIDGSRMILD
jgi:hypothetical protein